MQALVTISPSATFEIRSTTASSKVVETFIFIDVIDLNEIKNNVKQ